MGGCRSFVRNSVVEGGGCRSLFVRNSVVEGGGV